MVNSDTNHFASATKTESSKGLVFAARAFSGFVGRHPSLKHTSRITNECCSKVGDVFEALLGIWHRSLIEAVDCQHAVICFICFQPMLKLSKKHQKVKCSLRDGCDRSLFAFSWRFTVVRLKKSVSSSPGSQAQKYKISRRTWKWLAGKWESWQSGRNN